MAHQHDPITQYCEDHLTPESDLAKQLFKETVDTMVGAQMLSGHLSSAFLQFLIGLTHAKKILEIGTYTGHSALSMAEALPDDGKVITIEKSEPAFEFAKRYFSQSPHHRKIKQHQGLGADVLSELIKTETNAFDLIFIDADKPNYPAYLNAAIQLTKINGIIVVDNALWGKRVLSPETKQDHAIAKTNDLMLQDKRLENILLPIADGMHLARKISD